VSCVSTIPASASAFCCTSAAASVTGVIAPINVKGVTTTGCPCAAMVISPSLIASSKRRGELTEMIVSTHGSSTTSSSVSPREIAVISIASNVRWRPMARQWKTRSVNVRFARYVSRWRVPGGSSCGAVGWLPTKWITSKHWASLTSVT
jgi:hypothetical protein